MSLANSIGLSASSRTPSARPRKMSESSYGGSTIGGSTILGRRNSRSQSGTWTTRNMTKSSRKGRRDASPFGIGMIKKLSGTGSIDRSVDGDSLAGKTDSDYDRSEAVSADMRFM